MTTQQRAFAWIAGFLVFVALLVLLRDILLPFVVGMAVAYFLDPVCDRLEAAGCSRTVATTLVTVMFFVIVVLLVAVLAPLIYGQVVSLLAKLPKFVAALEARAAPLVASVTERFRAESGNAFGSILLKSVGDAAAIGAAVLGRVVSGIGTLFSIASLVVITPVVAFYLLRDWDRIVERVDGWLPRAHAETVREQIRRVDEILAGFVRGQLLVCALLGVFYAIGLTAVGLDFGIVVGLTTGFLSFVPYVGMLTGFAVGVGLALAQFDQLAPVALVAVVFVAGQVLEGNFLTPKLVGDRVNLHAVWIIFALLAGGTLFGFVGILLAVPAAAVAGVLVRFALDRYLRSPLYLAQPKVPAKSGGGQDEDGS